MPGAEGGARGASNEASNGASDGYSNGAFNAFAEDTDTSEGEASSDRRSNRNRKWEYKKGKGKKQDGTRDNERRDYGRGRGDNIGGRGENRGGRGEHRRGRGDRGGREDNRGGRGGMSREEKNNYSTTAEWIKGHIVGSSEGKNNSEVFYFVRANRDHVGKDIFMHISKLLVVDRFFRLENGTELEYTVHLRNEKPEVKMMNIFRRNYKVNTLLEVMENTLEKCEREVELTPMLRSLHAWVFLGNSNNIMQGYPERKDETSVYEIPCKILNSFFAKSYKKLFKYCLRQKTKFNLGTLLLCYTLIKMHLT